MKKTISITLALVFLLALLTSCGIPNLPGTGVLPAKASEAPAASDKPASEAPSTSDSPAVSEEPSASTAVDTSGMGPMGASFAKYTDLKSKAYERISKKIEDNPDLGLYSMTLLPVTFMDLALLPLTVADMDPAAAQIALGMFGAKDVKIDKNGNTSTVTYTDQDGKSAVFAAEFDQGTDSVQAVVKDGTDKEALFFEYVKVGNGYASQYFTTGDDGKSSVITAFFDDSSITAFGIKETTEKPASIFKNPGASLDIVKSADTYMILQDGKMTVHDKGEDKTF